VHTIRNPAPHISNESTRTLRIGISQQLALLGRTPRVYTPACPGRKVCESWQHPSIMTPPLSPSRPPDTGTLSPTSNTNPNPSSTANLTIPSRDLSKKHSKQDSEVSVATNSSVKSHKEYLDSLPTPTHDMVERITSIQEQKEVNAIKKRLSADHGDLSSDEREKAAELIQRNYRGHRERRMLAGMSLDPSTRWVEAIKEARYRNLTQPRARESTDGPRSSVDSIGVNGALDGAATDTRSAARRNWKTIGLIARRAGGDEDSDDDENDADENLTAEEKEKERKRRYEQKMERQKAAKVMDLQYWLEMVDLKHRYGSNLRTYHGEWKKSDTKENFFYWLDYGEGRYLDCAGCPREKLDREQVRYLSKEERLDYLVKIDKEGRLCWAKNGARIDTTEQYKDSIHGIVPATDTTPAYRAPEAEAATGLQDHTSTSESERLSGEQDADDVDARADKYATPEFDHARGVKKVKHVSAATIFNKLLRGTVKKNTWIFVADTSFRLYVGIKQSGAFQHSSFLHGSRISAAGLVKIKNGRLSKLSPLSGHYRPPGTHLLEWYLFSELTQATVSNFRAFVHSLKDAGADMSHVSISRSYAVLVGLEAYVRTRRKGKKFVQKLIHHRDKILSPDEVAKREEEERDKSESAERERRFLEMQAKADEEDRETNRANIKLLGKLRIKTTGPLHEGELEEEAAVGETKKHEKDPDIQVSLFPY
jgi:hypothetical protein